MNLVEAESTGPIEGAVDLRKVLHMRPVEHRRAEAGRLDRVLAAMGHQRATEKDEGTEPIE